MNKFNILVIKSGKAKSCDWALWTIYSI